jgi:hypothetical protein
MRNAQGYACITDPDGVREADTFTCFHCNCITHVRAKADPAELGGLCKCCMKLVCPKCVGKPCVPFLKKIEREEARYHARRSYEAG